MMQKVILSFVITLLFVWIKTQAQTFQPDANNVLYVNSAAAPGGDGSSWANAVPQLADALKWSRQQHDADNNWLQNDSLCIFIANGTYKPLYNAADGSYTIDGGRDNAFVMVENVQLYGGFPNTGNPDFDDRDWNANPTILSGDIGIANDNSDNTYHVVISSGDVGNASLNGLTITGGNADGAFSITVNGLGSSRRYGGGILNSSSSPAILNTSISNNSASYGGGICNSFSNSSPTILNTSISNNSALNGGGMFNLGSSPTILNTTISNNSANYGGGMGNSNASPTISNTTISNNSAQTDCGGMYNESTSPVVNNSIVFGNKLADASVSNMLNENASTPVFTYSLVGGATSWNPGWGTDGGNNIVTTSNPFADTANGDFSLIPGATAIDGGSNALYTNAGGDLVNDKDLAGNARVYGGIVDMGAYEYGTPVTPGAGNILYVNQNVSGGNGSGDSWANAMPELADALKWARQQHSADSNWLQNDSLRILIAKGTYRPLYNAADGSYTIDGGRDNAFVLVKNVQLYGGFDPAAGAGTIATRNWAANPTVLSGDLGTANDTSDNAYHVVISARDIGNALLNGFTITRGNASGNGTIAVNGQTVQITAGGGIYNLVSNPALTNLILSGNHAGSGGAMYNFSASPQLINVLISENTAGTGAGIRNFNASNPVLTNVTIAGNIATGSGGGMANNASSPSVNNAILFGNTATTENNIINAVSSTTAFQYSLMEGSSSWNSNWGTNIGGNIITSTNPFSDPANGDFSLTSNSPAINTGHDFFNNSATDLANNPRIFGIAIDMGAYEDQSPPVIHPDANGIIYVDSAAAPGGDGSSWSTALASFETALTAANNINGTGSPSGSVQQIWVAKGTYQPPISGLPFLNFTPLKIYGGFSGTEQSLAQRNLSAGNKSILKGNEGTVIGSMNSVGLVILDGFEVTGGNVSSGSAGGIGNSGTMIISNCIISNNIAGLQGGGIGNDYGDLTVVNCVITSNTAESGGGISNNGTLKVINCVIANNTAQYGGAVFSYVALPGISNSIIWGNTTTVGNSDVAEYTGAQPGVTYSIVEGGYTGAGNLNLDPEFVDTATNNYRLQITSPGINSGINDSIPAWDTTDLAGSLRIYDQIGGGIVDMGAYEYQDQPLPIKMGPLKGLVNQNDHTILSWNTFSESNNKGFQIQHSVDGIHFTNDMFIGSKATGGNSVSPLNYSVDMGLLIGTRYYRFLQIDMDGRKSYSNIVRVQLLKNELDYLLYPNPANQSITFSVMDKPGGFVQVLNQHGQVLKKIDIKSSTTKIDLKDLPPGSYLLLYLNNGKRIERKFTKI